MISPTYLTHIYGPTTCCVIEYLPMYQKVCLQIRYRGTYTIHCSHLFSRRQPRTIPVLSTTLVLLCNLRYFLCHSYYNGLSRFSKLLRPERQIPPSQHRSRQWREPGSQSRVQYGEKLSYLVPFRWISELELTEPPLA